jgi:DNA-binding MarR family transcriptional regulator
VLEQAGYVKVKKGYVGKRPRTWLSLTPTGRSTYEAHLAALTEIAHNSAGGLGRQPG